MNDDDDPHVDDQYVSLLVAYDEALAEGTPFSSLGTADTPCAFPPVRERDLACLQLLRQRWPRRGAANGIKTPDGAAASEVLGQERLLQVGRFEIRRELGRGAFGVVYLAYDPRLGRKVALKLPRPEALMTPELRERFLREGRAAAGLDHPNVVPVHEAGEAGPICYIAAAYCSGPTLSQWLKQREEPVPMRDAAGLVAVLADALSHAHGRGVVHRDLKPGNVLLQIDEQFAQPGAQTATPGLPSAIPKITDFGLAKLLGAEPDRSVSAGPTRTGAILGTPRYMAPEQAGGDTSQVGPAADLYALGVILYELLTGRTPFHSDNVLDTLEQVRSQEPLSPGRLRARLPRDLETICLKCLQKEPKKRYADAAALADDLRRFLAGEPIRARATGRGEKFIKWTRRHPAMATLTVLGAVAALNLVGMLVAFSYNSKLETALVEASEERARADRLREEADDFQASVRYARDTNMARSAWDNTQLRRVNSLLDVWRPAPDQPTDRRGWEWYYLKGLCHQPGRTIDAHGARVSNVQFSPNGRLLATAGFDNTVKLWEVATRKLIQTLTGHTEAVLDLAFSPDGKLLVSVGKDHTVRLWEVQSGRLARSIKTVADWHCGVAFNPDGSVLTVGSVGGGIYWWNTSNWQRVFPPYPAGKPRVAVQGLAFSPDGRQLVSAAKERTARSWDMGSGKELRRFEGHAAQVFSAAFSPNGKTLATGSEDMSIKLWDVESGKEIRTLRGHNGYVLRVAFSPDGLQLASASYDATLRLWDVPTGEQKSILRGHAEGLTGLAFSPDGRLLASADAQGKVLLWDTTGDRQDCRIVSGHKDVLHRVVFDRQGQRLATASSDGTIRVWDASNGREIRTMTRWSARHFSVAFSPNGERLAAGGVDRSVVVWDVGTGRIVYIWREHKNWVVDVAFHPDGRHLASASWDHTIKIWDVDFGKELQTLAGHTNKVNRVAYSPDGRTLASASGDGTCKLWIVATGEVVRTLAGHTGGAQTVAFSADGEYLAAGCGDGTVKLWHIATGEMRRIFTGHADSVADVAFHPDGRRIVTSSSDQTIKLWDVASGQETLTLVREPVLGFYSVTFSPDGRRLAATIGRNLWLWEANGYPSPEPSRCPTD